MQGNIDILMISERKLFENSPPGQFLLDGHSVSFRLDRNGDGGGILLYKLQKASKTPFNWFNDSQIKINPDKCHCICRYSIKPSIMIENEQISDGSCEILPGVFFDSKLIFQSHIGNICKKHRKN